MLTFTPSNLAATLPAALEEKNFVQILDALIRFLRQGGRKKASAHFDLLLHTLKQNEALCRRFSQCFYQWLKSVHVYPALVQLGIFSRDSFLRELSHRIYERFSPSYKDLSNLRDVFLYLFHSGNDEKWLNTISLRQWLSLYECIESHADEALLKSAHFQLTDARLRAIEMLSLGIASEALNGELIRLSPRLLQADSAFVALQHEAARLVEHYRQSHEAYDTAHLEVMYDQCQTQVDHLRRRGTGAGSGSSVKVAHLLMHLQQTLGRLKLLVSLQTQPENKQRLSIQLIQALINAAVEQYSTHELRRSSIRMLARSITENTSNRGENYITRDRREYLHMFYSAAGGGIIIALMALHKIHIGSLGFGAFVTAVLSGLNYGIGFMLIHMLHLTVATKQPAMTAANFAEQVESNERGRAVSKNLAKLLIDVCRSQSIAVFGNVTLAVLLACLIASGFATQSGTPLLDETAVAYQWKTLEIFTQPTLWYAAIAGVWLFCSGIIAGFFDNRADYLDLRKRLTVNPLLRKIMSANARKHFAAYMHNHYGSLMGNFIFGMLLGLTGWFGHLLGLPLDIRHVAFSSANLGYAAVSGDFGIFTFIYGLMCVLAVGLVNLLVSFTLALFVALRSRGVQLGSIPSLLSDVWHEAKANPLMLVYPVQTKAKDTPPKNG